MSDDKSPAKTRHSDCIVAVNEERVERKCCNALSVVRRINRTVDSVRELDHCQTDGQRSRPALSLLGRSYVIPDIAECVITRSRKSSTAGGNPIAFLAQKFEKSPGNRSLMVTPPVVHEDRFSR